MSEYQYYDFLAIDRPLNKTDQEALRALSSRAEITATRFTNTYHWGDFRGDPKKLMASWFDLHLYLANWGSRRLMIKAPKRLVDPQIIAPFIAALDDVELLTAGQNVIVDINMSELDADNWVDDEAMLARLAPLRADLLQGDLRLFYLLWLMAVEYELVDSEEPEPLPGLGPSSDAIEAFASFFGIDSDLVEAAAERPADPVKQAITPDMARRAIAELSEKEKASLLARVYDGDAQASVDLRAAVVDRIRRDMAPPEVAPRTAGALLARAEAICQERERKAILKAEAERRRQAEAERKARRVRMDAVAQRGESVWQDIEADIERRNADGYNKAAGLLHDLHAIAQERGESADFSRRLKDIRERHARKPRFIDRLADLG